MITLTDINGRTVLLAVSQIAMVTDPSASQYWHGVRANVHTVTGKWMEVRESVADVQQQVEKESQQ